jgi:hypothetical protein
MDDRMKFMVVRFQLFLALLLDMSLVVMVFTHHDPGPTLSSIIGTLNGVFFLKEDVIKVGSAAIRRVSSWRAGRKSPS